MRRYLEKELIHLMMSFVFALTAWLTNESSGRRTHAMYLLMCWQLQPVCEAAVASFKNTCLSRAMELFLLKLLIREVLSLLSMISFSDCLTLKGSSSTKVFTICEFLIFFLTQIFKDTIACNKVSIRY